MSRIIESPVKKWPGTITIPDFLTINQAITYEDAIDSANKLLPKIEDGDSEEVVKEKKAKIAEIISGKKYERELLPGIFACVESWNLQGLENISVDNFPGTPKRARAELFYWLLGAIADLYKDEAEIPNAL